MNRIFRIAILLFLLVIGAPLLLIGALFAWNMFGQTHEARFLSPSRERLLLVVDDCRFVGCLTRASLRYEIAGREAEMDCGRLARTDDRFVFAGNPRVEWDAAETKVSWQEEPAHGADGAPLSGTLDLVADCHHQVQFVEKGLPLAFRFRENCLGEACRREMILWYSGSEYLLVPCPLSVPGRDLVFSTGDDGDRNVEVAYDAASRRATWRSLSTGRTGVVDIARDCDPSRQWRETPPA